jgi:hypothetical protein
VDSEKKTELTPAAEPQRACHQGDTASERLFEHLSARILRTQKLLLFSELLFSPRCSIKNKPENKSIVPASRMD